MKLTIYKIISYLLIPVAAFLGFATLIALVNALGNAAMLLSVFISGATVLYIFSGFAFLQKGILKQNTCRPGLKDLIKVNAYVAVVFAMMGLIQGIAILLSPGIAKTFVESMMAMQTAEIKANSQGLMKIFYGVMYFMIVFSGLLLVHLTISFRFLKQYQYLFSQE